MGSFALLALGLVIVMGVTPSRAATVTWTSAVNGSWSDGTKWSTNPNPPQAGDDVVINVAGTYTVTLDVDVTVKSVTIGGSSGTQTLQTSGRTLTLTNASTVNANGVLTVNGGTLTGAGNLTVSGTFNWTAGTVSGAGTFTVGGKIVFGGGSTKTLSGRSIVSNGSAEISGTGSLILTLGAMIRNGASGTFDVQTNAFVGISGSPTTETFDNDGTLLKSAGTGTATFDVNMDVSGPVTVSSGILAASRGGSWSGTVTMNAATLRFNGGTHNLSNLTFAGSGQAEVTGGTVNTAGSVTVAAETTLLNSATLGGAGALTVNGTFAWTAGTVTGTGTFTVNNKLIFDSGSSKTLNGRTIVSNGTGEWRSAGSINLSNGAVLRNAATGTLTILQSAFMGVSGTPGSEMFVNEGSLTKNSEGSTVFDINMIVSGPVTIGGGTFIVTRAGTWTGPLTIGTTLRFGGGTHSLAGLTLAGSGRTEVTAGTVNIDGAVTVASSMTLANGSTIGGAGALTVDGRFEWTSGSVTGTGPFTVNGTLIFDAGSSKTLNGRTLVSNNQAEWRSGGTINLTNGAVLRNAPTGTFDIQNNAFMGVSGAPGTEMFKNEGALTRTGGTGITTLDVNVESSGPVSVTIGVLALSRQSTWTGQISVSTTLRFSGGTHALTDVTINGSGRTEITGGTVNTLGSVTTGENATLTNSATLGGSGSLTVEGRFEWTAGTVTGTGAFVVNGAMVLDSGSSKTLTGRTLVSNGSAEWKSAGTVNLGNNAVLRNGVTGSFDIQSNGFMGTTGSPGTEMFDNDGILVKSGSGGTTTFDVLVTNSGGFTIQSGIVAFTRAAYVQTAGSTTLNGGNVTAQVGVGVNLQGGRLAGNGTITGSVSQSGGTVAPGFSPGRLIISSDYTENGGALDIELGGLTAATQHDQLRESGLATLNGTLNVVLIDGFVPSQGDQFVVVDGDTTGFFSQVNLPPLPLGLAWQMTFSPFVLTVVGGGPTLTPSATAVTSSTPTRSATTTRTASATALMTASGTPATRTSTRTPTATATPTATGTPTSLTVLPTPTPTPTGSETGSPTLTATASPSPTSSPTSTALPSSTPTSTATRTASPTASATRTGPRTTFNINVIVLGPAAPGTTTQRGLRPIPNQLLTLRVCLTVGACLAGRGDPSQSVLTNAQGRATFEVALTIVTDGSYVMIEAIVDGIRCRLIITPRQLAVLANRAGLAGGAFGALDGELNVDPIVEAAARLLEDAGGNSYDQGGIEPLIDAVDAANADTRFDGLTLAQANDLAEMTANDAPSVQNILRFGRLCPGDCDSDDTVRVNELVRGVNIALGRASVAECFPFDTDVSDTVTVNELVTAVNRLIRGCSEIAG